MAYCICGGKATLACPRCTSWFDSNIRARYCCEACRDHDLNHKRYCKGDAATRKPTIDHLCAAAKDLNVNLVRSLLLTKGDYDINQTSRATKVPGAPSQTPFENAFFAIPPGDGSPWRTQSRKLQTITLLLEAKASPKIKGSDPLLCDASLLRPDLVNLLIDFGANPNAQRFDLEFHLLGQTPLLKAILAGSWSVAETLLERGADAGFEDIFGRSAFTITSPEWKAKIAKVYCKKLKPLLEQVLTRDTAGIIVEYLIA